MTIMTKGLPSAAPRPFGACHVIAANVIGSCYPLFPTRRFAQPLHSEDTNSLPRKLSRSQNLLRSLLVVPCGRPGRSVRTDLLHSARALQMRISLGSQTR